MNPSHRLFTAPTVAFLLFALIAGLGLAAPADAAEHTGLEEPPRFEGSSVELASPEELLAEGWSRFEVERNGWTKKVRYRDLETGEQQMMKYKGMPWSRITAANIVIPEHVYNQDVHRVRYRFTHPQTGEPLTLRAWAKSQSVRGVPIRSDETEPVVQLYDRDGEEPWGTLRYDYHSRVIFTGVIDQRDVEIERISEDTQLNRGVLKMFLFPYPLEGEFVARIDGEVVARWEQKRHRGIKAPYDLLVLGGDREELREDAWMTFIVFDLMQTFVSGIGS
ncbi:MAG: hypothetical protein SX243_13010 [Acidobacteriota bacterium]|nr:hypothetical protein [Acidobacteriota bacterium]